MNIQTEEGRIFSENPQLLIVLEALLWNVLISPPLLLSTSLRLLQLLLSSSAAAAAKELQRIFHIRIEGNQLVSSTVIYRNIHIQVLQEFI